MSSVRTNERRATESRAFTRDLNDQLASIYDTWSKPLGPAAGFYVCECDDSECAEVVEIITAGYRRTLIRPVLALGHESAGAHQCTAMKGLHIPRRRARGLDFADADLETDRHRWFRA